MNPNETQADIDLLAHQRKLDEISAQLQNEETITREQALYLISETAFMATACREVMSRVGEMFLSKPQVCAYCDYTSPVQTQEEIQAHTKACEKHPMSALVKENERLKSFQKNALEYVAAYACDIGTGDDEEEQAYFNGQKSAADAISDTLKDMAK